MIDEEGAVAQNNDLGNISDVVIVFFQHAL